MASRVEIVTGSLKGSIIDNAASEATLQEILDIMKKMEAKVGTGGGGSSGGSSSGSSTASNSNASNPAATALMAGFAQTLGAMANALKGTTTLLMQGQSDLSKYSGALTEAASHLPIVGGLLGTLGSVVTTVIANFENWNKTLKNLSENGASFNNNILEMRVAAAQTNLSLEQFASLVKDNSAGFAALGGTVTQGAHIFSKMSNELLQPGGLGGTLMNMGMSVESINSGLAKYLSTTMRGTQVTAADTAKMTSLYADYATNLDKISKITGEEKSALEAKTQAVKNDAMWQAKLAGATPEMKAKMEAALTQYSAIYGTKGAQAFKELTLTGQVVSKDSRMLASVFPEMTKGMKSSIEMAKNNDVVEQQMTDHLSKRRSVEIADISTRTKKLEGSFAAGAAGIGGAASDAAAVASDAIISATKYGSKMGELTAKEVANKDAAAVAEQKKINAITQILDQFSLGMKNLYNTILSSLLTGFDKFLTSFNIVSVKLSASFQEIIDGVDPLLDKLAKGFNVLSDFIEDNISPAFDILEGALTSVTNFVSDNLTPILIGLGVAVAGPVMGAIGTLIAATLSQVVAFGGLLIGVISVAAPFIAVAAAVAGAVILFKKFGGDMEVLSDGFKWLWSYVEDFGNGIMLVYHKLMDKLTVGNAHAKDAEELEKKLSGNKQKRDELETGMQKRMADNRAKQAEEDKKVAEERANRDKANSAEREERAKSKASRREARDSKHVKVVLLKLTITQSLELNFRLMPEFTPLYCRCMTVCV